jgi:ATP-dependent DNA ligase
MRSNGTVGAARLSIEAAQAFKARSFALDGELIGENEGYDFYTLPVAIRRGQVVAAAIDLLFLGGKDMRRFPLARRKEALTKLVTGSGVIQEAETFNDPIALAPRGRRARTGRCRLQAQ